MTGLMGLVQSMSNLQVDAQAALPVSPNNGNPAGANNMPAAPVNKALQHYPWLGPSPYMTRIQERLAGMANRGQVVQPPVQPAQPVMPTMPVIPQRIV